MAPSSRSILIADDDQEICAILAHLVQRQGAKALVAHDGYKALKLLEAERPDLLLTDLRMPGIDGLEVLRRAKDIDGDLPVVVITGYADVPGAVEAMKAGAHHYFSKPFDHRQIVGVIARALEEMERKRREREDPISETLHLREVMGPGAAVGQIIADVDRVAKSDFSVVILGETGSGKELVARAIHEASSRSAAPFVPVDCGAIPEALLESELFGHEKGAFTGADLRQAGKFEAAQRGTLFLDEIGNMALGSQAKLLRVLQEKKAYRVGGTKPLEVNVRLLAASNQDLEASVSAGRFRRDLFFRLNEFTIKIPPLRERREDVIYLAERFLHLANRELSKNVPGFSGPARQVLLEDSWPGNVRQLRSTIRRAVLLADEQVTEKHLNLKKDPLPDRTAGLEWSGPDWKNSSLREIVRRGIITIEREVLTEVLRQTRGNKAWAARMLHIDYKTVRTKVRQLGIFI